MSTETSTSGDLHDPEASPAEVARRISLLIKDEHPNSGVTVVSRTTSTSWTIEASIVRHDHDLADERTRMDLIERIRSTASRFGNDASIPAADHEERDFRLSVVVHEDYWSMRQASRLDTEWKALSPKAFLGMIRCGTRLRDEATGAIHTISSIGRDRFETDTPGVDGPKRWSIPRAAAIRRRGGAIRFARGSANRPDEFSCFEVDPS